LRGALLELVGELVGDGDDHRGERTRRWQRDLLRELGTDIDARPETSLVAFVPTVLFSHVRLLLGMVRANRPWRFAARLYGALVAALAVGAYGLVSSDMWRLADSLGPGRLTITAVAAIAITILAIIVVHRLWERAPDPRVRDQVVLFNIATTASVVIGILTLYAALFALILIGALLVITPDTLARAVGHDAGTCDYLQLAWFVASFAAIGGGLGAVLESDEAIRVAAYASTAGDATAEA
jgi:hypothetical protein